MIFQQIIESATPDISVKIALALAHYVGCITERPNGIAWCLTQYNGHRLDHSIVHKPQKITRSPSFCNFPSPNMHLCCLCSIWDVSVTLFLCSFLLTVGVQLVFLFPLKLLLSWVGKAEGLIVSMIFKVTIMVSQNHLSCSYLCNTGCSIDKGPTQERQHYFLDQIEFHLTTHAYVFSFFWAPGLELKLSLPNNKNQGKCGEFEPYFHTSTSTYWFQSFILRS